MSRKRQFTIASTVTALGLAAVAQGAVPLTPAQVGATSEAEIPALERPVQRFERNLELGALRLRYAGLTAQARKLDAEPQRHLLDERVATGGELRSGIADLRERVADAEEAADSAAPPDAVGAGTVAGVSLSTLEAIAACESGGDPTAVNAAGYYGKYQFDLGTWASVGGSGNPAEAPEAEQDYRAALLYSQAGASPWPVCGA